MAPATGAGTKRKFEDTGEPDAITDGIEMKAYTSASTEESGARCRLLELPAELRNRVYFCAAEDPKHRRYHPLLRLRTGGRKTRNEGSVRKFFSLTQTYKQIREEYRPIWLRGSLIRVRSHDLSGFMSIFYPTTDDLQHASKALQISWYP